MDRCFPVGNATIFMNGTRNDTNRNSSGLRHDSSVGIEHNCRPLALACNGMLPLHNALSQVLHTHWLPSLLM